MSTSRSSGSRPDEGRWRRESSRWRDCSFAFATPPARDVCFGLPILLWASSVSGGSTARSLGYALQAGTAPVAARLAGTVRLEAQSTASSWQSVLADLQQGTFRSGRSESAPRSYLACSASASSNLTCSESPPSRCFLFSSPRYSSLILDCVDPDSPSRVSYFQPSSAFSTVAG